MTAVLLEVPTAPRLTPYRTGPILDQGTWLCPFTRTTHPWCREFGFCVEAAWTQWLMSAPLMTKQLPPRLHLYHASQETDEWPGIDYAGTSVRACAKVLQAMGHIERYVWAPDAETAARWMQSGKGGVVFGTLWTSDMSTPDKHGFVHPTGRVEGGHAYYSNWYSQQRGAFRVPQSWGPKWGDNGRFWLAGEDADKLLRNGDGECCAAIERKVAA